MKKILAFNGSARKTGNTHFLLKLFLEGVENNGAAAEEVAVHEINLDYCTGCLRCNLIKRCSIRGDEWNDLSTKITESDVLVFASPIYFHHFTAQLKKIIDRFRSFVHAQITETGLKHTPHYEWNKDIVLLLSLGSSSDKDAQPVIKLMKGMVKILGKKNRLHIITATRLGVVKQVTKTKTELAELYPKLGLSDSLVELDFEKNQQTLRECFELGEKLSI
jgi:multimeric flavodoxin WrbA